MPIISTLTIKAWQRDWPDIPLYRDPFAVSLHNETSIDKLWHVVQHECRQILAAYMHKIPSLHVEFLKQIQQQEQLLVPAQDLKKLISNSEPSTMLHYLQATGDIVAFPSGDMCARPLEIFDIVERFRSRNIVQQYFRHSNQEEICFFFPDDVGRVLNLHSNDPRLDFGLLFIDILISLL